MPSTDAAVAGAMVDTLRNTARTILAPDSRCIIVALP
jgi:hypothetical protein